MPCCNWLRTLFNDTPGPSMSVVTRARSHQLPPLVAQRHQTGQAVPRPRGDRAQSDGPAQHTGAGGGQQDVPRRTVVGMRRNAHSQPDDVGHQARRPECLGYPAHNVTRRYRQAEIRRRGPLDRTLDQQAVRMEHPGMPKSRTPTKRRGGKIGNAHRRRVPLHRIRQTAAGDPPARDVPTELIRSKPLSRCPVGNSGRYG